MNNEKLDMPTYPYKCNTLSTEDMAMVAKIIAKRRMMDLERTKRAKKVMGGTQIMENTIGTYKMKNTLIYSLTHTDADALGCYSVIAHMAKWNVWSGSIIRNFFTRAGEVSKSIRKMELDFDEYIMDNVEAVKIYITDLGMHEDDFIYLVNTVNKMKRTYPRLCISVSIYDHHPTSVIYDENLIMRTVAGKSQNFKDINVGLGVDIIEVKDPRLQSKQILNVCYNKELDEIVNIYIARSVLMSETIPGISAAELMSSLNCPEDYHIRIFTQTISAWDTWRWKMDPNYKCELEEKYGLGPNFMSRVIAATNIGYLKLMIDEWANNRISFDDMMEKFADIIGMMNSNYKLRLEQIENGVNGPIISLSGSDIDSAKQALKDFIDPPKGLNVDLWVSNSWISEISSWWLRDKNNYDDALLIVLIPEVGKVSLRSVGNVDCGAIAKRFGGGGHKGAAAFSCYDDGNLDIFLGLFNAYHRIIHVNKIANRIGG